MATRRLPDVNSPLTPSDPPGRHKRCDAPIGILDLRIDVSIIIVNWNTIQLLRDCLSSLLAQGERTYRMEIIVVDNGSRDTSVDMVRTNFPSVNVLVNSRNMGFAAANNRGLGHAHGRYLLLLNSDTIVLPGAVDEMVRYMDDHPHVGAVGPRLLNEDGFAQLSAHDFPRLDHDAVVALEVKHWPLIGDLARRYARHAYGPQHERTHTVDWVMGACLLLRREAVEQAGVLDDKYFFFFEEPDLCYRLRHHGWPTIFMGSVEIVHRGGRSRERIPATSLTWYYRGLLRFYRLHAMWYRYLLVRALVVVGAVGNIVWRLLVQRRAMSRDPFLAAYARILMYALRSGRKRSDGES